MVKKVVKKKVNSKSVKKVEDSEGMDVDDALSSIDDEGVESGKSRPRKLIKAGGMSEDELDGELNGIENSLNSNPGDKTPAEIKALKPVSELKKGDKIKIDDQPLEVDAHYVFIDHGATKEMAIELFDSKTDKDYQLRYFSDQVENSLELYELQEIIYVKKKFSKIEW